MTYKILNMSRQERLKKVMEKIEQNSRSERGFDELYSILLEEYSIEEYANPDFRTNSYLNNLRQTRDKQANLYIEIKKRRPVKGAPEEYRDFIRHFKQDISEATRLSKPPTDTTI